MSAETDDELRHSGARQLGGLSTAIRVKSIRRKPLSLEEARRRYRLGPDHLFRVYASYTLLSGTPMREGIDAVAFYPHRRRPTDCNASHLPQ